MNICKKKFWTFNDTKNYKSVKQINDNVIRTFVFDKSFLLQIKTTCRYTNKQEDLYVIPLVFISRKFPYGHYIGIGNNKSSVHFYDEDITKVIL